MDVYCISDASDIPRDSDGISGQSVHHGAADPFGTHCVPSVS